MRRLVTLSSLLLLWVALAGCGGDDKPSARECADLVGTTVPEKDPTCTTDGDLVVFLGYDCDDGGQFWAADEIHGVAGDKWKSGEWEPDWAECTGNASEPVNEDEDEDASGDDSASAPVPLACEEVWVPGRTLPADYTGCDAGGTGLVAGTGYDCSDGNGALYAFEDPATGEDKYFAVTGGKVQDASDDAAYERTYQDCLG